ncbi:hypothetical protein [Merismopedia glauca]|uniref:Uncharacterized protein n=1 Tax=Merismopedia glauca CCAP 1448/3 TaxID=1296344 RepID=A0A2T1BYF3_9CYAN|nr:hypothetical protein [Merismopedia glauca]PSB00974.1 hypothetical protein C7B64_20755 [Merismopedia glauca CCAP 1448/3]
MTLHLELVRLRLLLGTFFIVLANALPGLAQVTSFSENNKTITSLGAQSTFYYFRVKEPLTRNCAYGVIYVAAETKGIYAQLLAAKLNSKTLSRIDYSQPGGNGTQCNAEIVEFN